MAGVGLDIAKVTLQIDIQNALEDAFKATFTLGGGEDGDKMARRFAQKGAPKFADAILKFIKQAQITGTIANGVVSGASPMGPVTGQCTSTVGPMDLSIK